MQSIYRTLSVGVAAIALIVPARAVDDPDLLRYPAPKLQPKNSGCSTIHEKSTLGNQPLTFRICIGDNVTARDYGCHSVADIYHTDKRIDDPVEDMKRRQKKFGCEDLDGLKLRVTKIYEDVGLACGIDFNRNKWCSTVEAFEENR